MPFGVSGFGPGRRRGWREVLWRCACAAADRMYRTVMQRNAKMSFDYAGSRPDRRGNYDKHFREGDDLDPYYYALQELDTVTGLVKDNGTLAEAYVYDAYGKVSLWGYRDFDMDRDGDACP